MLDKVGETHPIVTAAPEAPPVQEAPAKSGGAMRVVGRSFLALLQAGLMIAVLVGAYFATQRLIATKPEPKKRPAFKTVYTIETVTAQVADNRPTFTVYGSTVAARTVDLRALVAGEIVSINENLRAGSRIEQGATLLTIDPFQYRGALAEAEANLAEARGRIEENEALIAAEEAKRGPLQEQIDLARADLARIEQLLARGTGTQQQVEARRLVVSQREQSIDQIDSSIAVQRARLTQLEASIARLDWKVEQAQRNVDSTTLAAPFTGIVRSTSAEIGRNVSANDVVVSLYEADTLEASFTLSDAQYGRLAASDAGVIGRAVTVSWTVGGQTYDFPATIERLGADITSSRGGVEVFARLADTGDTVALRPGAFVAIEVPDRMFTDTIAIPDTAIYRTDTVYIEVDGALVERKVTIAAYEGENAIVSDGLDAGDEVLTTRITEVSEGLNVRREGDPEPEPERERASADAPAGRPSPEEIAAIAKANDLTVEAFRALPRDERRALVRTYREADKDDERLPAEDADAD